MAEIETGLYVFGPEYGGAKLTYLPLVREKQWKMVSQQIFFQARTLKLKDPLFLYSHVDRMAPLCADVKAHGLPLIHICMDYPEPYQYELIEISERTLVIPPIVFHKLKAKFGDKIEWIPQSIHLARAQNGWPHNEPADLANLPHPRLGYLGPVYARLNLPMLAAVLSAHPEWQFIYFGEAGEPIGPNAHSVGWRRPEELPAYVSAFDVGIMPYDCFDEKNLHCSPLKLFDYFLSGIPVVSTPIPSLSEYSDLIYFGETAKEFSSAIERALAEPLTSPMRKQRAEAARNHSTDVLGRRLAEILKLGER
ncbi:MAG: glycosyltransferase [Candidatus Acidiferrales bacterium]